MENRNRETWLEKAAYLALMLGMSWWVIGGAFWQKIIDDTSHAVAQVLIKELQAKWWENIIAGKTKLEPTVWADMPNNEKYEWHIRVNPFDTRDIRTYEWIVTRTGDNFERRRAWDWTTPINLDSLK